nr:glycoside hydrolase family 99-like domain-containing protein [Bacteroidota bacterium]
MNLRKTVKDFLKKRYAGIFLRSPSPAGTSDNIMRQQINSKGNEEMFSDSPYEPPENQPEHEKEEFPIIPDSSLKPIAFYLPQYHPFEENSRFWGKGFTEWHNVSRALPLFQGHHQPKLPGELGFYDLRLKEVLLRQIELANKYGIYGFCFHHYYLEHKPVMRDPFNLFLSNKDLDIPFCLHWANEPWTVRWDGEREKGGVLLDQTHDDDENRGFIEDAITAFRDERYIRIDGKPVLLIYRPGLFPDFRRTAKMWRSYCSEQGLNGLYLVMVMTFFDNTKDPQKYSCDAAMEFPPHQGFCVPTKPNVPLHLEKFKGEFIDYKKMAAFSSQKKKPSYTMFRGVMPGWDNTARTKNSKIYYGSSPAVYQEWLAKLVKYTEENLPPDRQFIFINAWNEWAEGAYLEPDRKYGYAYLNATSRAMIENC